MGKSTAGRETSVSIAYQCILNKIVNGELPPGTPLREVHLAAEFDLSPTPVREAMRCLEYEGWLRSIPYRGRVVRSFTSEDVTGSFLLREGIECMAVQLFVNNAPPEVWEGMRRELAAEEAFAAECSEKERGEFRRTDLHFHELLCRGASVPLLTTLHARIRSQLQLLYRGEARMTPPEICREHRMILEALEAKLVPVAEGLVRHHIRSALARTLERSTVLKPAAEKRRKSKVIHHRNGKSRI